MRYAMRKKKSQEGPKTTYCKHAVAWVDLLSQKDALNKLKEMPVTPEEEKPFLKLLDATFGQVRRLRDDFRRYYEGTRSAPPLPDWLPEEARARITELRAEQIGLHGVADAMALYIQIYAEPGDPWIMVRNVWNLHSVLSACATMMLVAVTGRQVIRGGIDIGIGGEIEPGEIYGPALSRAYILESKKAQYPRILIGEELMEYLYLTALLEESEPAHRLARVYARDCLEMTTVDDDGRRILHYLSNGQRQLMMKTFGADVVRAELMKGYKFITRELDRFRREGKSELVDRYRRFKGYFDFYLSGWM
jgi:hypothetical protein